eukprot:g335.t1
MTLKNFFSPSLRYVALSSSLRCVAVPSSIQCALVDSSSRQVARFSSAVKKKKVSIDTAQPFSSQGLKETLKTYGKVGFFTHYSVAALWFCGAYILVSTPGGEVVVDSILSFVGFDSALEPMMEAADLDNSITTEDTPPPVIVDQVQQAAQEPTTAKQAARFGLAYAVYKAVLPLRAGITVALTPIVVALLPKIGVGGESNRFEDNK